MRYCVAVVALLSVATGLAQAGEPLTFSAELHKQAAKGERPTYLLGEPVAVTLCVRNTGREALRILQPTVGAVSSLTLYLTDPDGGRERVPLLSDRADASPRPDQLLGLAAGEETTETLDLSLVCPLDKPGHYTIEIVYIGAMSSALSFVGYWEGSAAAPELAVSIAAPPGKDAGYAASLLAGKAALRRGDARQLLAACRRLWAGAESPRMRAVLAYYSGRCLEGLRRAEEAPAQYQRAARLAPDSDAALLAKRRLSLLKGGAPVLPPH